MDEQMIGIVVPSMDRLWHHHLIVNSYSSCPLYSALHNFHTLLRPLVITGREIADVGIYLIWSDRVGV